MYSTGSSNWLSSKELSVLTKGGSLVITLGLCSAVDLTCFSSLGLGISILLGFSIFPSSLRLSSFAVSPLRPILSLSGTSSLMIILCLLCSVFSDLWDLSFSLTSLLEETLSSLLFSGLSSFTIALSRAFLLSVGLLLGLLLLWLLLIFEWESESLLDLLLLETLLERSLLLRLLWTLLFLRLSSLKSLDRVLSLWDLLFSSSCFFLISSSTYLYFFLSASRSSFFFWIFSYSYTMVLSSHSYIMALGKKCMSACSTAAVFSILMLNSFLLLRVVLGLMMGKSIVSGNTFNYPYFCMSRGSPDPP